MATSEKSQERQEEKRTVLDISENTAQSQRWPAVCRVCRVGLSSLEGLCFGPVLASASYIFR